MKTKMRFVGALDLWDLGTIQAIQNGQLRLQPGQWVRCGNERLSRLVRISEAGVVWAIHPKRQGKGRDGQQFREFMAARISLRNDSIREMYAIADRA